MPMRSAAVLALALVPALVGADDVYLVGGGRLSGVVLERTPASLTIRVGPGLITIPASRVERVVAGRSPLETYEERAGRLSRDDAPGWLALASWAKDQGLLTQARAAFEHVALLAPDNAAAQRALGNVLLGDKWVTPEESFRARGYVRFEGTWMTPEERDAAVQERAAQARAAEERARADEAEARAREAEARAREAEAAARAASGGIPYSPFVFPGMLGWAAASCGPPFTSPLVTGARVVRPRRVIGVSPGSSRRHDRPPPQRDGGSRRHRPEQRRTASQRRRAG